MNEMIYKKSYREYKEELDQELGKTAEGFVRIGYLLKVARDTDVLKESGYANVVEFAQAEYSIDKTQVSRFIHINDKFSEDGYSDHLLDQYKGFGYSKLTLMLAIPEEINVELSPAFTREEIKAIKEEVEAEKQVTDIEVMLEEEQETPDYIPDKLIFKVFMQMVHDDVKLYEDLCRNTENAKEILCPDSERVYSVRIPGTGRIMAIFKADSDVVSLVNVRTNEKTAGFMEDVRECIDCIVATPDRQKENWEILFKEPYPVEEKPEVAPEQQKEEKKEEKKEAPKTSKVVKAKKEKADGNDGSSGMQKNDFMPEPAGEPLEDSTEENKQEETVEESSAEDVLEEYKNTIRGYKAGITAGTRRILDMVAAEEWEKALNATKDVEFRLEQIIKLSGGK